ncbi:MAG: phage major capsid protein [Rhodoferax sp.]|nr:phage major capsid protein [Rhodoferax sp.]
MSTHRTPFSLSRTLEALSDPEPGDLSAVLDQRVYDATFGRDKPGNFREGYPGVAVRIPLELLARDLTMGTPTAGGNLAGQPVYSPRDALRGFSIAADYGMQVIDWPAGSLPSVPAISAPIEFGADISGVEEEGFRAEGDAVRDADLAFSAQDVSTSTIGCSIKVSRKLIKQGGPAVDAMLRRELLRFIGERIDYAVLSGRGPTYDEPMGLCNHEDIIEEDGTDLDWEIITAAYVPLVGQHAALRFEALRAVCAPGVAGQLSTRTEFFGETATFESPRDAILTGATLGGVLPAAWTQSCKLATMVIGDFSRAALLVHGGITLIVDPRFNFGAQHRFTILADIDVIVPQPTAFRRIVDIT